MHKLCQEAAPKILESFQPQLIIAIGGGGYVPARILRSFLKQPGSPNIPIQAIGLSLYEQLPVTNASNVNDVVPDQIGTKVTRTQWLDLSSLGEMQNLVGKRILIVDEVDDTRTTLEYAVKELEKDVEEARQKMGAGPEKTKFSIFVLHVSCHLGIRLNSGLAQRIGRMLTNRIEQGQAEEGHIARGYDRRIAIPSGQDDRRFMDMLSMGSHRYR